MTEQVLPKAKKSVALSGTAAGNTAICTVISPRQPNSKKSLTC